MPRNINKKALVIEDDASLREILKKELTYLGYQVDTEDNGLTALQKALSNTYNIIISDVSLPRMNGMTVLQKLREQKIKVPVIMITNYDQNENERMAFVNGANIFHKKPITFDLLNLQIKMLSDNYQYKPLIEMGDIVIDPAKRIVKKEGKEIDLTKREYNLFLILISSPGEVFSRREILNMIPANRNDPEDASIDTLVSRIRKKMGRFKNRDVIETIYAQGYRLSMSYLEK